MKTKVINSKSTINVNKSAPRLDLNKKIQFLTDKLASHFKVKLASHIAEKNYPFSQMILEIGDFLRKLENSNFENDSVILKLEKHLLEILSKMSLQSSKNNNENNKSKNILKTDLTINNNYKTNPGSFNNLNSENLNNDINNQRNISVKGNNIQTNYSYKNVLSEGNIINMNNENEKNHLNKPGAHLILNPVFSAKTDLNKNKKISTSNTKQSLFNINSKNNNINDNILSKHEYTNNLVTEANLDLNNKYNLINKYNINETNDDYEALKTYTGRALTTKMTNFNNDNTNKSANLNLIHKTDKVNDLKEKAMDEWAMIVKYNHLKHLEDEQHKKNLEEEKKKRVKEILENQMKERDEMKRLKQEEDKKFFRLQTENLENMEKNYLEKERIRIEKIKNQKEMQEKLIKESQDLKNEMKIKDKIRDKMILEKLKNELNTEEEKLAAKKISDRQMYLNIIRENENKIEMKKKEKEMEKLENKRALEEYTNLIEKQEKERLMNLQNKIVKSNNNYEIQNQKAKKQEELLKNLEEKKILKEKEEIDIKNKHQEDTIKYKKQRQLDDIKSALKNQIEDKKRLEIFNRRENEKYIEIVKNNTKKYNDEKEFQIKNHQTKLLGYKESLDQQLQEKGSKRYYMDEKEKQFNKELIGKIYSEFIE